MIQSLIRERENTRNQVVLEVNSKWATEQQLVGPIISVPYLVEYQSNEKTKFSKEYAHFLPSELYIDGKLISDIRKRSIYEVIVYSSDLNISGTFEKTDFSIWKIPDDRILYDETIISFGISDMRGINEEIIFKINGTDFAAVPGVQSRDVINSGVSALIGKLDNEKNDFSVRLSLNGSQRLSFIPIGKKTRVNLTSNNPNPSFDGNFLPDSRDITGEGFKAEWHVLELNRNYPQKWLKNTYQVENSEFGVRLVFGVDLYQKAERSAKYAIMFLALTFLIFILSEITNKKRIHPIQYLFIGIALIVFYSLLISLAEQIGFDLAYLIASLAVVALITAYTFNILKSRKITLFVSSSLIILYCFLYTILQLQDFSLLIGSIGLFIVIATMMYLSRKIDWYGGIGDEQE